MSATIKAAITALKGRIAAAYSAISAKGGTLPATQDSANLASAIATIPSGGGSQWTGHIDEVGLRAIGWRDEDIAWFKEQIDWNADADDSMKVPQELIDAYNDYVTQHGAVDSAFYANNKVNWWFRYAPYVASPTLQMYRECKNIIAIPNSFPTNQNYLLYQCTNLRYIPQVAVGTMGSDCFRSITAGVRLLDIIIDNCTYFPEAGFFQSVIRTFKLKVNTSTVDLKFTYPPLGINFLDIDAPRVKPNNNSYANFTSSCLSCRIKGLCGNLRLGQAYIAKEDLLYIINNETTTTGETAIITMVAAMYNIYSVDLDVTQALTNHPNISLASA